MSKTWKIAGINFDHMHMGDLLRRVHEHPQAEIVGICDEKPERMQNAIAAFDPHLLVDSRDGHRAHILENLGELAVVLR